MEKGYIFRETSVIPFETAKDLFEDLAFELYVSKVASNLILLQSRPNSIDIDNNGSTQVTSTAQDDVLNENVKHSKNAVNEDEENKFLSFKDSPEYLKKVRKEMK